MSQPHFYIFDLDGTLIDSLPGIARALAAAFTGIGREMPGTGLRDAIGPPIRVIAARLDQTLTEAETLRIEQLYRPIYDGETWRDTALYPGVRETLQRLRQAGHPLAIVTNKPRIPAQHILIHLGIADLFIEILTRDTATPSFPSKSAMVADLLTRHFAQDAVLVGDTVEDAEAAGDNHLRFVHAVYGYGTLPNPARSLVTFSDLLESAS